MFFFSNFYLHFFTDYNYGPSTSPTYFGEYTLNEVKQRLQVFTDKRRWQSAAIIASRPVTDSSWRRSSFHDWASRPKRLPVLQHQRQTRNDFQPGQRPRIRSVLGTVCCFHVVCVRFLKLVCFPTGILVNGQIIGDKKIPPDGVINTYFYRFGITHRILGVRLEVNTMVISVYQGEKWIKLLWSEASSLKGPK